MTIRLIAAFLLLLAPLPVFAETPLPTSAFPEQYVKHPCAANAPCVTFEQSRVGGMNRMRGQDVPSKWIADHWDDLYAGLKRLCDRVASCYATRPNDRLFCNDVMRPEVESLCASYPEGSEDRRLCIPTAIAMWEGVDLGSGKKGWEHVDACLREMPATAGERKLAIHFEPALFDASYSGTFRLVALDAETRVPVQAILKVEGENLVSSDAADGRPTANLPLPWKLSWRRAPNAAGHSDLVPPTVTVAAAGYEQVVLPLPLEQPALRFTMTPETLVPGENQVTITAHDERTGKPVEMRVMLGDRPAGRSNQPFTLKLEKGKKRAELWMTSLFNRYHDVVVLPAEK